MTTTCLRKSASPWPPRSSISDKGGAGVAFEQVVAELGFTMDQVRNNKSD